jgi:hypothetical protein
MAQADTALDDLKTILGESGSNITVGGKPFVVKEMTMKQYPAFMQTIAPIIERVRGKEGDVSKSQLIEILLIDFPSEVRQAVQIASGISEDDIDALSVTEFMILATSIIVENIESFTRRMMSLGIKLDGVPGLSLGQTPLNT